MNKVLLSLLLKIIIIIIIIIIIVSSITVFSGVFFFVHQPGANHAPGASFTQVNHSVHTLIKHLSEDSRRSQYADFFNLCHNRSL